MHALPAPGNLNKLAPSYSCTRSWLGRIWGGASPAACTRGSPWYNSAIAGGKSGRRHVTIAEWCCVFVAPAGLSYALYTAYKRQSAGYGA
jgi:hypothetical protein